MASDTDTPSPILTTPNAAPQADARQVILQKIYLRDASIEAPLAPQIFARPWQPAVDVNVGTSVKTVGEDTFNLILTITVTAKLGEDTAFLVEVQQAGVFLVRGFPHEPERAAVLGGYCPSLLFPFAREAVADFVQKAGFPQLLLQPINFEALLAEHLNRARAEQQRPAAPSAAH